MSSGIALTILELAAKGCGLGTCRAGLVMMAAMSEYKPLMEILTNNYPNISLGR
jgi:hypothetical protein